MTSAPRSARCTLPNGPAPYCSIAMMRRSASGFTAAPLAVPAARVARRDERGDSRHLVADDHHSLVYTHARLGEHLRGAARHRDVRADLRRTVRLVAGPPQYADQPVAGDQQQRLDGVVDAAEVRRLDVDHVGGASLDEKLDVFKGVAPLVDRDLHVTAASAQCCTEGGARP